VTSIELDALPAEPFHERSSEIHAALLELTVRQRAAIALFYYLDMPVKEVADVMHCSEGTIKSTLSDARRRLRKLLEEGDYER
jgi:RNA polymerase sigma-70 factor (ECF subfamily)